MEKPKIKIYIFSVSWAKMLCVVTQSYVVSLTGNWLNYHHTGHVVSARIKTLLNCALSHNRTGASHARHELHAAGPRDVVLHLVSWGADAPTCPVQQAVGLKAPLSTRGKGKMWQGKKEIKNFRCQGRGRSDLLSLIWLSRSAHMCCLAFAHKQYFFPSATAEQDTFVSRKSHTGIWARTHCHPLYSLLHFRASPSSTSYRQAARQGKMPVHISEPANGTNNNKGQTSV